MKLNQIQVLKFINLKVKERVSPRLEMQALLKTCPDVRPEHLRLFSQMPSSRTHGWNHHKTSRLLIHQTSRQPHSITSEQQAPKDLLSQCQQISWLDLRRRPILGPRCSYLDEAINGTPLLTPDKATTPSPMLHPTAYLSSSQPTDTRHRRPHTISLLDVTDNLGRRFPRLRDTRNPDSVVSCWKVKT